MKAQDDPRGRREEFINAAQKLFQENGVVQTTVNAIVKEGNVAKGQFYYYFNSMDDVIEAVSQKYSQQLRETLSQMASGTYEKRLNDFIDNAVVQFRLMWDQLSKETSGGDFSILAFRSMVSAKKAAAQFLTALLEEGNRMQKTDIPDPENFARMLIGGIADLTSRPEVQLEEIEKMVKNMIKSCRKDDRHE